MVKFSDDRQMPGCPGGSPETIHPFPILFAIIFIVISLDLLCTCILNQKKSHSMYRISTCRSMDGYHGQIDGYDIIYSIYLHLYMFGWMDRSIRLYFFSADFLCALDALVDGLKSCRDVAPKLRYVDWANGAMSLGGWEKGYQDIKRAWNVKIPRFFCVLG